MNDNHIYCIVRYGLPKDSNNPLDNYSLITINRKTGTKKELLLPHYNGFDTLGYGLKEDDNGSISPFIFIKKGRDAFIQIFD